MTGKKVYAYNELTDVVRAVPAHYINHPTLGKNLRIVSSGKTRGRLSEIVGRIHDASVAEKTEEPEGAPTEPTNVVADKKDD